MTTADMLDPWPTLRRLEDRLRALENPGNPNYQAAALAGPEQDERAADFARRLDTPQSSHLVPDPDGPIWRHLAEREAAGHPLQRPGLDNRPAYELTDAELRAQVERPEPEPGEVAQWAHVTPEAFVWTVTDTTAANLLGVFTRKEAAEAAARLHAQLAHLAGHVIDVEPRELYG